MPSAPLANIQLGRIARSSQRVPTFGRSRTPWKLDVTVRSWSKAPVLYDRWLEVNRVARKPTPTIGSIRCKAEVRGDDSGDSNGH
jgi:hypothetical protein